MRSRRSDDAEAKAGALPELVVGDLRSRRTPKRCRDVSTCRWRTTERLAFNEPAAGMWISISIAPTCTLSSLPRCLHSPEAPRSLSPQREMSMASIDQDEAFKPRAAPTTHSRDPAIGEVLAAGVGAIVAVFAAGAGAASSSSRTACCRESCGSTSSKAAVFRCQRRSFDSPKSVLQCLASFYSRHRNRTIGYTIAYPPHHGPGDELPLVVMPAWLRRRTTTRRSSGCRRLPGASR